jgi:hypothetical protein
MNSAITYLKERTDFPFILEFSKGKLVLRKETETENSQNQNKKQIETEFRNVNIYMEKDISDCQF